jgi:Stress responsive A/B Barrel Domain
MPFRHIVLLTLDESCDVEALVEDLRVMATEIPSIRRFDVGNDVGASEGNASIAVVADFDDQAGWQEYRDHPVHVALIAAKIRPHLVARTAVQHLT